MFVFLSCLVNDFECVDDVLINSLGKGVLVESLVHGLQMALIAAVLHSHHRDILAVVELGVARRPALAACLFKVETFACATDDACEAETVVEGGGCQRIDYRLQGVGS